MSNYPTGDTAQASAAQIYAWAIAAGFPPAAAVIATAITYPESGGHPGVVQSGQPYSTTGWGLWQITPGNSVPSVGVDNALLDGATNARAAYAKYKAAGSSFRPWTTYTSGAYKNFLPQAQAAASESPSANAAEDTNSLTAGIGGTVNSDAGGVFTNFQNLFGTTSTLPSNEGQASIQTDVGGAIPDDLSDFQSSVLGSLSGIWDTVSGPVQDAGKIFEGILWLFNPANEIRVLMGFIALVFLGGGTWLLIREARG